MSSNMRIGQREIGNGQSVFIVAELGSNHDGKLEQANQLIDIAADAGCDAVKIQIPIAEECYPPGTKFGGIYGDKEICEVIRKNEIPQSWIPALVSYGHDQGLLVGASADGFLGLDIMLQGGVDFIKFPSFTISHIPLLRYASRSLKPILLSTGVHAIGSIEEAITACAPVKPGIFHCISAYPTPLEDLNLASMQFLKSAFQLPTGFSDHSLDPTRAPALATALGANLLEKHFTISRKLEGTDHFFALEPDELRKMVEIVRRVEGDKKLACEVVDDPASASLIGTVRQGIFDAEQLFSKRTQLGIYFRRTMDAGQVVGKDDVRVFRCADTKPGLHPRYTELVEGARLVKDAVAYQPVDWDHIISGTD